ncbi:MAG: multidrug effflux MFS transporter [Propionibacteriaceae bacterium]|jgi:DHA1 family bicyclomycin/chloramphenicol resistance-like MFS transporter|nr:multidrug effflux MFS transporter [Propionibacteriaceae bacterium]
MWLTPRPVDRVSGRLLVVVALLAAVAPFATDVYLPAFPAMTGELDASASQVQLTLTAFLLGAGLGQLVFGPWSDRVGRRRPLIAGTAVCVVAGLAAAGAPTITVLIAARAVQGLSGAAGMVLGRAIISDVARGREAVRAYNLTSVVMGVAPVAAPLIGSLLAAALGWRGLLLIVAGVSLVTLAAVIVVVPETHPVRTGVPETHPVGAAGSTERPARRTTGLTSGVFVGNTLTFVLAFAAMMAYISASPFVYQVMIGMDQVTYGLLFGGTAAAITVMSVVAARMTRRFHATQMLRLGVLVLLGSAVALTAFVACARPTVWLIAPLFVGVAAMGLIFGNATALALSAVPHGLGTASAILGASQFAAGALVSPLVGVAGEHSAIPLTVAFGTAAVLAGLACAGAARAHRRRP